MSIVHEMVFDNDSVISLVLHLTVLLGVVYAWQHSSALCLYACTSALLVYKQRQGGNNKEPMYVKHMFYSCCIYGQLLSLMSAYMAVGCFACGLLHSRGACFRIHSIAHACYFPLILCMLSLSDLTLWLTLWHPLVASVD